MKTLDGQEALDELKELEEQDAKWRRDRLAAALIRAKERGKEVFDLDRFEAMYKGRLELRGTREERLAEHEYDYYVTFDYAMTMQEYAKRRWEAIDQWDGP